MDSASKTQGIALIDKPFGVSSHWVVNFVRRQTGVRKVGHTGTLDPIATGLLVLLVGREYTKQQDRFLKQNKEYVVTARLGIQTNTYDIEGEVTDVADFTNISRVSRANIDLEVSNFTGEIQQTVPSFSAVKIGGQKLYDMARAGEALPPLPTRTVSIFELEVLDWQPHEEFPLLTLRVACSSGTYIRSLVHDLGQALGVGATVFQLRRTKIGTLSVEEAIGLESFSPDNLKTA